MLYLVFFGSGVVLLLVVLALTVKTRNRSRNEFNEELRRERVEKISRLLEAMPNRNFADADTRIISAEHRPAGPAASPSRRVPASETAVRTKDFILPNR